MIERGSIGKFVEANRLIGRGHVGKRNADAGYGNGLVAVHGGPGLRRVSAAESQIGPIEDFIGPLKVSSEGLCPLFRAYGNQGIYVIVVEIYGCVLGVRPEIVRTADPL